MRRSVRRSQRHSQRRPRSVSGASVALSSQDSLSSNMTQELFEGFADDIDFSSDDSE